MAKLKYEFQNEYYKTHNRRLRDYLFAYIGPLTRIGAPFGKLINWGLEQRIIRKMVDPIFHLTGERKLPAFALNRSTFSDSQVVSEPAERIILLRDTFTHFYEPEIEGATLAVLAACGVKAEILPYFGAGRTLISKGFIEPARRHARRILEAVRKLDPDERMSLLGIEPSELYTLRDEFLDLLPEYKDEVVALAERSWLVDEFLVRPRGNSNNELRIANTIKDVQARKNQKILLHGHCYQKAQPPAADGFPIGQGASAELLHAVGYEVEMIPSGCCGMAGAFGYEAEHYELSMQVGELSLFPTVRDAQLRGHKVSAVGTSCRAQIMDGTGSKAIHPLVLVANILSDEENC
jgi:Fe-S oxidoreductase